MLHVPLLNEIKAPNGEPRRGSPIEDAIERGGMVP
jgi:hypothetical protein